MRDWIVNAIQTTGPWGVALLMFAENVFPPIPSELIMPLAGYLASQQQLNFWLVVAAGSFGSLLGAWFWFEAGRRLGETGIRSWLEHHGAWLTLCPEDIDKACAFFERHGRASVFFGRLIPVVRTLVSVPAGFARMHRGQFLLYSAGGTIIWTALLALAGRWLGASFPRVGDYVGLFTWAVIGAALLWYVLRVIRLRRRRSGS